MGIASNLRILLKWVDSKSLRASLNASRNILLAQCLDLHEISSIVGKPFFLGHRYKGDLCRDRYVIRRRHCSACIFRRSAASDHVSFHYVYYTYQPAVKHAKQRFSHIGVVMRKVPARIYDACRVSASWRAWITFDDNENPQLLPRRFPSLKALTGFIAAYDKSIVSLIEISRDGCLRDAESSQIIYFPFYFIV